MELTIEVLQPNIIEIRDATGLSQESFALLCEFSRATLTNIENGKFLPSTTTLNKISSFTTIGLEKITKRDFIPPINLREKLQKKYSNDPTKSVLLEHAPSVPYIIKYRLLKTTFLDSFRERLEILTYIKTKYGWEVNPNTLTTNLKRLNNELIIKPNPKHDKGYVYKKL
ncbi:DNA-binding transcriptional regulator, XRE-family HTH domain [Sphingobacterium nematocida]|uniref:DNA-binding transcriptional regulator, XRE-family HTH domain n=1 Tax=Sphingobacterium nematocida TaxID=1513896 RepID=A0A1T5FLM1_9SPHI|nr:helix-turn-helix transcriptional regulator [Sphingobacterium nematocida]SKB97045.1 DNA-binding transcriptional regulator, XRE-family HTH domain [Sphingobacterium nematocida]